VDGNFGIGQLGDPGPKTLGRPAGDGDDQVRRLGPIDELVQAVNSTKNADGVGLPMNGKLPPVAGASWLAWMSGVDVPDDAKTRPGPLLQASRQPLPIPSRSHDQDTPGGRSAQT
jgi:hypothetical protein